MTARRDFGRVYFPGNPWPKGHRIVNCSWSARIERSTGVWCDIHLVSEKFYAADKGKRLPEEDDDLDPTASRTLWYNFHCMTLSTTFWPGLAYGFQLGSRDEPFNYRKLSGKSFKVDDRPSTEEVPRPFGLYRWGHEVIAHNVIEFRRERNRSTFAINWSGRIGSPHAPEFPYVVNMKLKNVAFSGIVFPPGTDRDDAYSLAEWYVHESWRYKFRKAKDQCALLP